MEALYEQLKQYETGSLIKVHSFHSDGLWYRAKTAVIEAIHLDRFLTNMWSGTTIQNRKEDYIAEFVSRSTYFFDRPFYVLELYAPEDGRLLEIYVNINSPIQFVDGTIHLIDWELDVSLIPGKTAVIVDQDEFAAAVKKYNYSPQFQTYCHQLAQEAVEIANNWQPQGIPQKL